MNVDVTYLSLRPCGSENGFCSEEHQKLAVLLTQMKRLPQDLERLDSRPHRAGVVSTERPQPLQQVLSRHQLLPAEQDKMGRETPEAFVSLL